MTNSKSKHLLIKKIKLYLLDIAIELGANSHDSCYYGGKMVYPWCLKKIENRSIESIINSTTCIYKFRIISNHYVSHNYPPILKSTRTNS